MQRGKQRSHDKKCVSKEAYAFITIANKKKKKHFRDQTKNFHFVYFFILFTAYVIAIHWKVRVLLSSQQEYSGRHKYIVHSGNLHPNPTVPHHWLVTMSPWVVCMRDSVTNKKNPLIPILVPPSLQSKMTLPKTIQLRW